MWLITPIGFFSVVQKPSDRHGDTLTIRARVRTDLEALRARYLPTLGPIEENQGTDYRYRAVAPRGDVAAAMAQLVQTLDYGNFKSQVAKTQGRARAHLYGKVWDVLFRLQTDAAFAPGAPDTAASTSRAGAGPAASAKEPAPATKAPRPRPAGGDPTGSAASSSTPVYHPRPDNKGRPVRLTKPSTPTPLEAWHDPGRIAVVVPDGPMPAALAGIPFAPWQGVPMDNQGWEALAQAQEAATRFDEPPFRHPPHMKPSAGVVIREPDGRVWVVAPSNAFGGYEVTLPKGTREAGMSLRATALREAYEESGLRVALEAFLVDVTRTTTHVRYYLARRVGGTPADMGWESQAVMLVPPAELLQVLTHPNDARILAALAKD